MSRHARALTACLAMVFLLALTSCDQGREDVTLRVLASPELADLAPLLGELKKDRSAGRGN